MKNYLLLISACFIASGVFAQTTYPNGVNHCIARWDFNSADGISTVLPDVSGNGNDGVKYNLSPSTDFRAKTNTTMHFDGSTSYALVSHKSMLSPSSLTIVALVKFDSFYSGSCQVTQIVSKGYPHQATGNYGMGVGDNTYDASCSVASPNYVQQTNQFNSAPQTLTAGHYLQTGKWYFLASSYDGNTVKYYQKEMTTTFNTASTPIFSQSSLATPLDSNTQDISIGKHLNPAFPYWFGGTMDELALFNKVLNDSEIQSIYGYLWVLNTDVPKVNANEIHVSLSPNPSTGSFTITGECPSTGAVNLTVSNAVGQVVYQTEIIPSGNTINSTIQLPECANGIYTVQLSNSSFRKALRLVVNK